MNTGIKNIVIKEFNILIPLSFGSIVTMLFTFGIEDTYAISPMNDTTKITIEVLPSVENISFAKVFNE
jgi:hypothetical protein